jgi:DNA-directed RNA polymerase specialized sigma24 family protein
MIPNILDTEKFEKLLNWLNPDRDTAGQKYESIRTRLIKIFYARGCYQAEEMADETMDRVTKKIDTLFGNYEGDPALYFYAVAKNVLLEFSRNPKHTELPPALPYIDTAPADTNEDYYDCLDRCLEKLGPEQRAFIIDYYTDTKGAKVARRKSIAASLDISAKALRIRAFRIREGLRKCVSECIRRSAVSVTF